MVRKVDMWFLSDYVFLRTFGLLFQVLCVLESMRCHPQCLDFRPPFQAKSSKLAFCKDYQQYGCCTSKDDQMLAMRFDRIAAMIPATKQSMWSQCSQYAKTFLCQTCSPYSAHIFDSEVSKYGTVPEPRAFPGLCRGYCGTFYQTCKDLVSYYMTEAGRNYSMEAARLNSAVTLGEEEFCTEAKIYDLDYCYPELLSNDLLNGNISIEKVTKEGCLCMEKIKDAVFRNPIFLKHANDGSKRMFVGEQIGIVHVMYSDGTILPEPFVDIQADIKTTSSKGDERGMLGMEFHPNYKQNGKLYIYYSAPLSYYDIQQGYDEFANHKTRVEELKVSVDNPNKINYNYSRVIMEVYEPYWNHNGGEILFGDDGYLYLFVGDGGSAGDPHNVAQDLFSMLGKVLRIDVDKADPVRQKDYSIPPDNPFADGINGLPEIYAYGVRNIWRCGKDRGDPVTKEGKGRIVCGDVGQSAWEEIDLIEKGANYGWKIMEGNSFYCQSCNQTEPDKPLTAPIWDYPHSVGKSVTGGHFYRGCLNPNLNGYYIYGDFMNGKLFRLLHDRVTNTWNNKELNMCISSYCTPPLTNDYATSIISFGEDEDGEVYMLSTSFASTSAYQGYVYRIVDPHRRGHPENCGASAGYPATSTMATAVPTSPPTMQPSPSTQTTTTPKARTQPTGPQTQPSPTDTKGQGQASSGNINNLPPIVPAFSEPSRMSTYLDYYKRNSLEQRRHKVQSELYERQTQKPVEVAAWYRDTPKQRGSTTDNQEPPSLVMHGIKLQRCGAHEGFWCIVKKLRNQRIWA